MTGNSGKWKNFERLVTAIHKAADAGAEVRWNETIAGRQFDVTIRFRKGLYEYLTVVECKDRAKPVSVENVDAFVTKAADVHAHHAVMASTSGFQEGAREVARRHNITLIHVTASSEIDPSIFGARWAGLADALHIERIELEYADGERRRLPEEAHAMTYYANHVVIQQGSARETVDAMIRRHSARMLAPEVEGYREYTIAFVRDTRVVAPDDGEIPLKPLARMHFRAGLSKARLLSGPVMFEPYLLSPDVKVRNVATGEERTFPAQDLALGVDTVFEEGKFYEQPQLAMYYYCDRIEGDLATLILVESFQLGQLLQARLKVKMMYTSRYVEVTDREILTRLRRRLERYRGRKEKG